MKLTIPLAVAALSTQAFACITYHHTLQESFAATNTWSYSFSINGANPCSGTKSTSGDFGQANFDDECNNGKNKFHVRLENDFGSNKHGRVIITGPNSKHTIQLEKNGPDHQFGCGNTVCVGVESKRKGNDC